jgi:hypothetical protein
MSQEATGQMMPKSVPGANKRASELESAQKPYTEYEVSFGVIVNIQSYLLLLKIIAEAIIYSCADDADAPQWVSHCCHLEHSL